MVSQLFKAGVLELAHLVWLLYNKFVFLLVSLQYIFLLTYEQYDAKTKMDLRIPKHIALAFTNEDRLSIESIARLLCWCKELGINDITLYDDFGRLNRSEEDLYKCIEDRLSLRGYEKPISYIKGLKVLSISEGRRKFVNDIRDLFDVEPENIDYDSVSSRVGWSTDPELLINFGSPLCLHGFPPWQLRLTEILSIPTHRNLPQKTFIDCLARYSRTTQRVGA